MEIVVLDGQTLNPGDLSWSGLDQLGEVTIYDRTEASLIEERAKNAEIILINKTPMNRETIYKLNKLKYIGVLATGYNVVDIEAAKDRGIVVTNVPNYSTDSVAQLVFAFILEFSNRVGVHSASTKAGEWFNRKDFCYWKHPIVEISGKVLGIIGYGSIGKKVEKIAAAFNMKVLIYTRSNIESEKQVSLEELLEKSDFVSIHCPLNADTENLINKEALNLMKGTAYLINTSRGPIVHEKDLAEALKSHSIAGAGLDVVAEEPPREDNPLFLAKNCMITPHIGWAAKESRGRLLNIAVDNINAFIHDKPKNVL